MAGRGGVTLGHKGGKKADIRGGGKVAGPPATIPVKGKNKTQTTTFDPVNSRAGGVDRGPNWTKPGENADTSTVNAKEINRFVVQRQQRRRGLQYEGDQPLTVEQGRTRISLQKTLGYDWEKGNTHWGKTGDVLEKRSPPEGTTYSKKGVRPGNENQKRGGAHSEEVNQTAGTGRVPEGAEIQRKTRNADSLGAGQIVNGGESATGFP